MSSENPADQPFSSAPLPEAPVAAESPEHNGSQSNGSNGNHIWSAPAAEESAPVASNGTHEATGLEAPLGQGAAPFVEDGAPGSAPAEPLDGAPLHSTPVDSTPAEPVRSTLSEWVITILLLLFLTTTLVQAFVIPTGSMEDTLLVGDHLLVDKMAYSPSGPISKWILPYRDPKRGDIIVFRYPTDIQQTFVKRCMGIPGDRIHIVNKQVYINGKALDEPYKVNKTDYFEDYRDNFPSEPNVTLEPGAYKMLQNNVVNGEVVVPPGYYFAMGDNRDSSWDSRFWGFVPRQNIIGKPLIIYWSYDRPSEQLNTNSISLTQILDLATHFFSKTRWHRSFQLIHGYPVQ